MKSYGIEVQHVTTDDHGEWQVRTTNEDEEISSAGTFYVTVAKEPKEIKILCLNKVTSNMEECDDQVTHFYVSIFVCLMIYALFQSHPPYNRYSSYKQMDTWMTFK